MTKSEQYTYSIIIPHYNIPKLLKRCLASIPKRKDLQIIVVDDKSSEEAILFLQQIEHDFPHVSFVYSNVNGGGGRARNIGLQYAKGKYVLFADADDFFNYCINDILDEYIDNAYDIIYFNANTLDTDSYLLTKRRSTLKDALRMFSKDENLDAFRYIFGEPWCKLVKRELIEKHNIMFDEISIHNDTKYSYLIGYYAKEIKFDNRALYCLADRSGSVSKGLTDEKYGIRTRVFAEKNRFLKDHRIPYFDKLMITPFLTYLRRGDKKNFNRCLTIAKEYGFGKQFIIKKIMWHILCSKFKIIIH